MAHYLIYVPGLGDKIHYRLGQSVAIAVWRFHRIRPRYFFVKWADSQEDFDTKLARLLHTIDYYHTRGHTVSLLCASAGGSLALLAFRARPKAVQRVVAICPQLNNPSHVSPSVYKLNPAFRTSLLRYDMIKTQFSASQLQRILIVKPTTDKIVRIGDMDLPGSQSITLSTKGHLWTIVACLTLYSTRLARFVHTGKI